MIAQDQAPASPQGILILGAYGLIGHGISKRLLAEGYAVTGLGRSRETAVRVLPDVPWIERDMSTLSEVDAWHSVLRDVSVVVNCSGALQDGPEDDLENVHYKAVAALASACAAADVALVQISAAGAKLDASTPFLATKARGDEAIKASGAKFHIFRPGLVLAPNAYGGTALLRMLAAFPLVQPIASPKAKIQTVALDDIAEAVSAAISGKIPYRLDADLVETEVHSLRDVVSSIRLWLGFRTARFELEIPSFGTRVISKLADAVSVLGWRSPLRSTALKVLDDGILGEPTGLTKFGLPPVSSLRQTLAKMPVGAQDRLFARMALLTPVIVFSLCLFWLGSGLVGLARVNDAALVLENAGWPKVIAVASVVFWALVDIIIGAAFAVRKYTYKACWAAVGVSLFYLVASTLTVPTLWVDPLGPLLKIVPGIMLAIVARAALEAR